MASLRLTLLLLSEKGPAIIGLKTTFRGYLRTPAQISARLLLLGLSLTTTLAAGVRLAHADDPCAAFTWDVRHERTLFGERPRPLTAGSTLAAAPAAVTDQLYALKLTGQAEVTFPKAPGKSPRNEAAYAGLLRLTVGAAGVYRISLDQPVWVDVIANGSVVPARDHQGRPGCNAPHKIVEFVLPAGTPVTLQFSGGNVATAKVAVTRSPAQTP